MEFIVRRYRASDRDAVRAICADTALFGKPIERVFRDRDFVADALIAYHTDFEPESLFVAESGGRVIAYLAGSLDSRRKGRLFRRRLLPRLLLKFLLRGHWLRPRAWRLVRAAARSGRNRAKVLRAVESAYPAHCHVNAAEGFRRAGTGRRLFGRFIEYATERGARGMHVSAATAQGRALSAKMGLVTLARVPVPVLEGPPRETWIMGRRLSCVDARADLIARQAAELQLDRTSGDDRPRRKVLVQPELVPGKDRSG